MQSLATALNGFNEIQLKLATMSLRIPRPQDGHRSELGGTRLPRRSPDRSISLRISPVYGKSLGRRLAKPSGASRAVCDSRVAGASRLRVRF